MAKVPMNIETVAHNIAQATVVHYLSQQKDFLAFNTHKDYEGLPADLEQVVDAYEATYQETYKILKDREELDNQEAMNNRGF